MRDNNWLKKQLDHLLKTYFSDIKITSPLVISAGRLGTLSPCQRRFSDISIVLL